MPDVRLEERLGSATSPRHNYELGDATVVDFVKRYANDTDAARGISSRVRAGEAFGMLGPIAAEKSTTSMPGKRIRPTSGREAVLGDDIAEHPSELRRRARVLEAQGTSQHAAEHLATRAVRPVLDGLVCEPCLRRRDAYTRDEDEIQSLREALKRLDGLGRPIERARANAELGVALRRAGRLVEARQPLRVAVDLAHHCGAHDLEDWAMRELRAAGARPRRRVITGAGALTPSERRIAELAAAGHRNRDIAAALFVTLATVEFHLRNAYRKLGIASRKGLKQVLAAVPDVGPRVVGSSVAAADAGLGYRWELGSSAATATSWAPAR